MIEEKIKHSISQALGNLSINVPDFDLELPADMAHGDLSTNVAMVAAKSAGRAPRDLADAVASEIQKDKPEEVESISVAGPGFINFTFTRQFFTDSLHESLSLGDRFGHNETLQGKRVVVEYTDPNPFKDFHIGHLMPNVIGESFSRLLDFTGAEVRRVNYQGDVGMHVAKAIWGMMHNDGSFPAESDSLKTKIEFLGNAYAFGSQSFEDNEDVRRVITRINREVYARNNEEVNNLYDVGRRWSLDNFERIYKMLGTEFHHYFFESEVALKGKEIVLSFLKEGVFKESEGAIVFPGEEYGLHTRVFINSEGLPTYEAKELALAKEKNDRYPYDLSIIVTGNEVNSYFRVLLAAMGRVFPELAAKTKHFGHGMLRLPEGKMSSRKGNIITGESLLEEAVALSLNKMHKEYSDEEKERIALDVGVAAIKYTILKQAVGKDVIFDLEKSLSFEGDSGPYLQYSTVRALSVIEKAKSAGISPSVENVPEEVFSLEKLLRHFPAVITRSQSEFSPHHLVGYLTEISGEFNSFYAQEKIADIEDKFSPFKLALTETFAATMKNGLYALGIRVPEKM